MKNLIDNLFARARLCRVRHTPETNDDSVYRVGYTDGYTAAARKPVPNVVTIGKVQLHRLPSGAIYLTDGIAGTAPDEVHLESILRELLANRWKTPAIQTYEQNHNEKKSTQAPEVFASGI